MPIEPTGQDNEKDTQSELPTENQPADVEEQSEETEGSLPEDAKERTKAEFEKLTKANRELKEKLDAKEGTTKQSVLDSLRPQGQVQRQAVAPNADNYQNLGQEQVDKVVDDLVDADGYVDTARLKETLNRANQQAAQATAEARQARIAAQQANQNVARYTETEEMRRVHKDYPSLDPEGKDFDSVFFDLVRDRVISQMTKGGQDVHLAAQEISKIYKSDNQKAKEEADAEIQATTTAKEQINASGSSTPQRGTSQEDLVRGTMQGDRISMYERMKKSGY